MILRPKILSISSVEVSLSRISASVKNGGRRTMLRGAQSLCFLDLAGLPAATWKSTSVIGRWILSPVMSNVMLALIKTAVGESSDYIRENLVTDPPRDLLPMDACANVSCMSPGVALSARIEKSGKSSHTYLNFLLAGSLVRMSSWIERRFLLQTPFWHWWSINTDNALVDIIFQSAILRFFKRRMFVNYTLRRLIRKVSSTKSK